MRPEDPRPQGVVAEEVGVGDGDIGGIPPERDRGGMPVGGGTDRDGVGRVLDVDDQPVQL